MITYGSSDRFNSSYTSDAMSEEEAKKYAMKMGITDSLRGIQQIFSNIMQVGPIFGKEPILKVPNSTSRLIQDVKENKGED